MRALSILALVTACFALDSCAWSEGEKPGSSVDSLFSNGLSKEGIEIEWMKLPLVCSKEPDAGRTIDTLLLHFCSDVVANPHQPYDVKRIVDGFRRFRVSAHLLIDRRGKVFQLVSLDRTAYHAGVGSLKGMPERDNRLNEYSIGIELMGIGNRSEMGIYMNGPQYDALKPEHIGFSGDQYETLNTVIKILRNLFEEIGFDRDSIMGHDEWSPGRKKDPGELFDWGEIKLSR